MINRQEVFDKALTHLRKQGGIAVSSEDECSYRGPAGSMCAVGCLILDEHYLPEMEGDSANDVPVIAALISSGYDVSSEDEEFLVDVQSNMHDKYTIVREDIQVEGFLPWLEDQAQEFADIYELEYEKN